MTERYLTISDVMERLNLGKSSVYRRIADGTLPRPIAIGHLRRFKESELLAALTKLEEHRTKNAAIPCGGQKAKT